MSNSKTITFFMLVTNNDCLFANYAVKSFYKIYNRLSDTQKNKFTLFIYLNNLNQENKLQYIKKWDSLPYTTIYDNYEKLKTLNLKAGEIITSPEGIERKRDGLNENYDELWSTELSKFNTDYIATVDADFEILNADFYFYLIDKLEDPNCLIASTSYNPSSHHYDSYSNRNLYLHERNHTWFCIYKKETFEISKVSHFYYEKYSEEHNMVHAFDSAAFFQNDVKNKTGGKFVHLPKKYHNTFIHYGAGSKNKSITKNNIWFYRALFIIKTAGIFHVVEPNKLMKNIDRIAKKSARKLFKKFFHSIEQERSNYHH